jgi:hypothetical protein
MHKKSFYPPVSEFRQASSTQFIGRGVTLVMAATNVDLASSSSP